jgi:hypothetical protein
MSFKATSQADVIKQWQNLVSALADNIGDLPHLTTRFTKLQGILGDTIAVVQEQAAARADKQDASRRLEALLTEGQKVAAFLRVGIREQYGPQSEKLAEFHLLPRRNRRTAATTEPKPPVPEVVQPEAPE